MDIIKKRYETNKNTFRLILMDLKMPGMDGCETTRMIRKYLNSQDPAVEQPMIACLTNYSGDHFKQKALSAGMNLFQTKPIFKKEI